LGLVNGDTIGNFTIFSPGSAAGASVAGSPYPIVFSNPKSGSYVASNYQTVYVNGALTVLPAWPSQWAGAVAVPTRATTDTAAAAPALTLLEPEEPSLPSAAPAE
jgi:hypothetical protein